MLKVRKQGRTKVSGHLHVRALGLVQVLIWEHGASTLKMKIKKSRNASLDRRLTQNLEKCFHALLPRPSVVIYDLQLGPSWAAVCMQVHSVFPTRHGEAAETRHSREIFTLSPVGNKEKMLLLMFDFSATDEPIRTCLIMTGILVLSAQHHCKPLAG